MSEIILKPMFKTKQNDALVHAFMKASLYHLGGQEFLLDILLHLFPHLKKGNEKKNSIGATDGICIKTDDENFEFLFGTQKSLPGVAGQDWVLFNPEELHGLASAGIDIFPEQEFRFKIENNLLIVEEGKVNKILFSLKDRLIDVNGHLGEIIAILSFVKMVGGELLDYSERIAAYILRKNSHVFKDAFTKIEFVDYSHINSFEDVVRILKYTENHSIVVMGGRVENLPQTVIKKMIQKENDLILMDLFGQIGLSDKEVEMNPIRVKNVKDAVDMVYVLAENPSRVLLFPCMQMAETISPVLSRKFELEVVAC